MVGNLPAQPTPIIGREAEIRSIVRLFSRPHVRLVTLTGAGGSGKTRMAVEVGLRLQERFRDGVFFVDLAPLRDAALVGSAIAQPVGVRELGSRPLVQGLRQYLGPRELLLVLDNFEHVLPAAGLLGELLEACPGLRMLVTSRAPLRLRWEHEVAVSPLPVPDLDRLPSRDGLLKVPSVELFAERAQAIQHGFQVTDGNAVPVAQVCVRLDGLPLALELAAGWLRLLSPAAIVARLDEGEGLHLGAGPDRPTRHRSVETAIAWSYDLLSEPAKALFRRLAVFAGGWSLEAAEAICHGVEFQQSQVLELLAELTEQSLVTIRELPDGDVRYRFLEPIRDSARELLASSGESRELQKRHAEYMSRLTERARAQLHGPGQIACLGRLEIEHDNVRAALRWASDVGATETGLALAASMWEFWWIRGYLREGRVWLDRVLAGTADMTSARASCLSGAGLMAELGGDSARAVVLHEESVALYRQLEDADGLSCALCYLGLIAALGGNVRRGQAVLDEAVCVATAATLQWSRTEAFFFQGQLAFALGQHERAAVLLEESLRQFLSLGYLRGVAFCKVELAAGARHRGAADESRSLAHEALVGFREVGDAWGVHFAVLSLGLAEALCGQSARAVRLLAAAEAVGEAIGANLLAVAPIIRTEYDHHLAEARGALSPRQFTAAWNAGRRMSIQEAIDDALSVDPHQSSNVSRIGRLVAVPDPQSNPGRSGDDTGKPSERELEVLQLLARGLTSKEIATTLMVSVRTVEHHRANITAKLGARGRADLVEQAARRGWVVNDG